MICLTVVPALQPSSSRMDRHTTPALEASERKAWHNAPLRTPQGQELIGPIEISQQRDISFNESAVLAKEAEEGLMYRDMQSDIVQQLLRRLAAWQAVAPLAN